MAEISWPSRRQKQVSRTSMAVLRGVGLNGVLQDGVAAVHPTPREDREKASTYHAAPDKISGSDHILCTEKVRVVQVAYEGVLSGRVNA